MKRIFLFLATNLAVLLLLGIILSIFGVHSRSISGMLIIALMFGMGGSFISLAISKWMAKRAVGAQVIEHPRNETEHWLFDTVQRQAQAAGIGMPEVAIYDSPDINAFATGMKRNDALVAVSTGLLQGMDRDEVEAVLAHEISHVANGDMITLALIQGVVNTFVIFFARIIASIIDSAMSNEDGEGGLGFFGYIIVVMIAEAVLGLFATMIVMWFSRLREYRADAGGAKLAGPEKMIAALERLRRGHEPKDLPAQIAAFGISGQPSKFSMLTASHPPLEDRIAALQNYRD